MNPKAGASRTLFAVVTGTTLAAILSTIAMSQLGACATDDARLRQSLDRATYPPAPQSPRVVALGNLRSGPPPSDARVRLSIILFGEEPEPPLAFMRPLTLGLDRGGLLVCDAALGAVLRWDSRETDLKPAKLSPRPSRPVAAEIAPNGDILVADARNEAVYRYDTRGELKLQYALSTGKMSSPGPGDRETPANRSDDVHPFRPAAMLSVGDRVWVTNVLGHRIEIFDAATGRHLRAIGRRGGGPGEFGAPLGMARMPDGNICVVDSLNARVQVLDGEGKFIREVGGPGDLVGYFGRPKDVAVGPDGTVFVTDAASQRVHVFDAEGRALLAFPEPARRAVDAGHVGALSVPGGVCIATMCPIQEPRLPEGFEPAYYVLVAEQLLRPGIRVYAWGRSPAAEQTAAAVEARAALRPALPEAVANPHWLANRCDACHAVQNGEMVPHRLLAGAAPAAADALCLSCHDGVKAHAESHPIGRIALTANTKVPVGWPLVEDRLGCLTCHDIVRHCDAGARRPTVNPSMLRAFDAGDPIHLCVQCHKADDSWRVSPHKNLKPDGSVNEQSCRFCHVQTPAIPADGRRVGVAMLHADSSDLCLTCHTRHWDVSPLGHVDRPAPDDIQQAMRARDISSGMSAAHDSLPQMLPLSDGLVTCWTCHNPHERGLFTSGSPLAAHSDVPIDAPAALRVSSTELCLHCHAK